MKIKAKVKGDAVAVKMLINHVMETGRRKDESGELIPAHYIKEVVAKHQDAIVFSAHLGTAVSKDPYLSFKFKGGASGESISVTWVDSKGETETKESVIK